MDEKELTKQAISELGIDKPIMATRMVGHDLELHLYGGEVVKYSIPGVVEKVKDKVTAVKNTAKKKKATTK